MSSKRELIWHITGTVVETIYNIGRRDRPYWQVVLELDGGYACVYVRSDLLLPIAEKLEVGQLVQASGAVKPRREVSDAKKPIFLDPVAELRPIV